MNEEDQTLRYVVAGMLSTIDFTPAERHPGNMLPMADNVIHHIRLMTSDDTRAEATEPYPMKDAREGLR